MDDFDDDFDEPEPERIADLSTFRRPAIWPVFAMFSTLLALIFASEVALKALLVILLMATGVQRNVVLIELNHIISKPWWYLVSVARIECVVGIVAIWAARFSKEPFASSLGIKRSSAPAFGYVVFVLGSLVPMFVGTLALSGMSHLLHVGQNWAQVLERTTPQTALPLFVLVSFAPALCEELAFRGYIQRRLLRRWHALPAILLTSFLFGLFHMEPFAIVNAFFLGVWLGFIAWRTDSVWPGIACHAFINAGAVFWPLAEKFGFIAVDPFTVLTIAAFVVGVPCFALSILMLLRSRLPSGAPLNI